MKFTPFQRFTMSLNWGKPRLYKMDTCCPNCGEKLVFDRQGYHWDPNTCKIDVYICHLTCPNRGPFTDGHYGYRWLEFVDA